MVSLTEKAQPEHVLEEKISIEETSDEANQRIYDEMQKKKGVTKKKKPKEKAYKSEKDKRYAAPIISFKPFKDSQSAHFPVFGKKPKGKPGTWLQVMGFTEANLGESFIELTQAILNATDAVPAENCTFFKMDKGKVYKELLKNKKLILYHSR